MSYTPSVRAQVIARRTYSRPTNEAGTTFETWAETTDRVIMHQRWLWERALGDKPLNDGQHAELAALRDLIFNRKATVSGRTLWLGGTEVSRKRESSSFNCCYLRVATVHDVVDAMWLLLQGCGVGFSPVRGTLNGFTKPSEVEIVRSQRHLLATPRGRENNVERLEDGVWHLTVGDSAEAWAKAIGKIMANKTPFGKIVLDFSQIRPAGYRLKGYGWISSGDEKFSEALSAICGIMSRKAGQLLDVIDILDVCNWLGTTLSSRRSAEIALVAHGDPQWREFAMAKKNHWEGNIQRAQSNNSLMFYSRPSKHDLRDLLEMMVDAGGSEPGFVNAESALNRAPWFKGVNPCLVGDTLVPIYGEGLRRIKDLAGSTQLIRDGEGNPTPAEFRKTAENAKLLRVELSDGSVYKVTPSHNFVTDSGALIAAEHLWPELSLKMADVRGMFGEINNPNRAYLDAWLIADGTWLYKTHGSKLYLYDHKKQYASNFKGVTFREDTGNRIVANFPDITYQSKGAVPSYVLQGDEETVKAFIRGYTESDGHVGHTKKGWCVQFCSIYREFLQDFQVLLGLFGIRSKIALAHKAGTRMMPDGHGGLYPCECQDCWRLTVGNAIRFMEVFRPDQVKRGTYAKKISVSVVSVSELENREDVYCCGVPTTGTFDIGTIHSGNCCEILLGDKSVCNLVEVAMPRFNGDLEGLEKAVYLIGRANYRQTCVDFRDGILQSTWHELNQFIRLCGLGQTGIVQWEHKNSPSKWQWLRGVAQVSCNSMAVELNLPLSKAVTTIKPSGTLSKIMDVTEGLHRPLGEFIFNNVRFSNHDPMLPLLRQAGYNVFPDPYSSDANLVCFPVRWDGVEFEKDENGKSVNRETALDQLQRYRMVMNNYVDHNASITVSYDPAELDGIASWIHRNWDDYVGVSFLPRNDPSKTAEDLGYLYLPQEVVTEEVYRQYVSGIRSLNVDGSVSVENGLDQSQLEVDAGTECAGGVCPVK